MYVKLLELSWIKTKKINKNLMPTNKQTYLKVQIVTDSTITHSHTLKLASLKFLISEQLQYIHILYTLIRIHY